MGPREISLAKLLNIKDLCNIKCYQDVSTSSNVIEMFPGFLKFTEIVKSLSKTNDVHVM